MCQHCNYQKLLATAGLAATNKRLRVLEVIGNNSFPLTASQVHQTVARTSSINKVTVYRILDLLAEHGLVERLPAAGRGAYFGLAPNEHHAPHPHFFCTRCGQMNCLAADSLSIDLSHLRKNFAGQISNVQVRVDGICQDCLEQ